MAATVAPAAATSPSDDHAEPEEALARETVALRASQEHFPLGLYEIGVGQLELVRGEKEAKAQILLEQQGTEARHRVRKGKDDRYDVLKRTQLAGTDSHI